MTYVETSIDIAEASPSNDKELDTKAPTTSATTNKKNDNAVIFNTLRFAKAF